MVNPSFVATHHTTLRREYPPQTARVISSDIYLFSIGLTALLFVDSGAIRTQEEMALTSFIAGFHLAWGIATELSTDSSYSYNQKQAARFQEGADPDG